jgi:hypothetical protein
MSHRFVQRWIVWFALCAFAALQMGELSPAERAAETEWSAGLAAVKITPDKPLVLSGYAARTQPFERVEQDIFAKALALRDDHGHRAVLVTMDLTLLPGDVAEGVRKRIAEQTKLAPAAIVLSVSHTHSAPTVSLEPEGGAEPSGTHSRDTIAYTRGLADKLVAVAVESLDQLKPARLSWGTGVANFVMNRREFTDKGVILGVNPRGPVDRSVPVLRIDAPNGALRGVLFGYACHNTTLPARYLAVSGDYAGYAKAYVEQHFPGCQAMFMMGCGGDANPYPRESIPAAPAHGEELGKEVCRLLKTKLAPVGRPLTCAQKEAELPLETPDRDTLQKRSQSGSSLDKPVAKQMLAALERGETLPASHRAPVCVWQFGKDLTLVALPDEVVVDYAYDVENAIGPMRLWVAAYCNEVAGYIPSRRVLHEGGYETRGLYIGNGWFAPGVEDTLVSAVRDAASDAGRPTPR